MKFSTNNFVSENGIGRNREGKANFGYSKTGEDVEDEFMLSRLTSSDLLASIERLASDPSMQTLARRDVRTDDAIKSLRTLINDQRFQKSFQFAQKVCMKCFDDFFCYVLAFRIFLLSKIKNVPKYVAFGYRTIGGGLCSMKYSSKALFGIFLEYQKKKQYSLNWV